MPIPSFEELMYPLLKFGEKGGICSLHDAEEHIAKKLNLTNSERTQLKKSGGETTFANRLRWARLYLRKAGLINDPKRAHFQITALGLTILKRKEKKIDIKFLKKIEQFEIWESKNKERKKRAHKKKLTKKRTKKHGIIVLIDALGVKGIWKHKDSKNAVKRWTTFTENVRDVTYNGIGQFDEVTFAAFSDTIMITIEPRGKIEDSLYYLADFLSSTIIDSMLIGMPIRGCFSVGDFIIDPKENFIIGAAIDEAAEYYNLPQWIGISACPSAHIILEKDKKRKTPIVADMFAQTTIPLKKSIEKDAWAIDWTDFADNYIKDNSKIIANVQHDDVLELIYDNLEHISNLSASLKWRHTLNFYESLV